MTLDYPDIRVALGHHWLTGMRGGEKVLAAMAARFPDAPILTLLAKRDSFAGELAGRRLVTTLMNRFQRLGNIHQLALPWLPALFKQLDARAFDSLICSDASFAKAIRTRPDALKLCYCHSPPRYVWDLYDEYIRGNGLLRRWGLRLSASCLRRADRTAADTVTAFIANSHCVAGRIRDAYGRGSVVIHPPVDTCFARNDDPAEDFYLVAGAHVAYKRNDLAVEACNRLRRRLVVIGSGGQVARLHRIAGPTIELRGWEPDDVVRDYMRRCRALLFCGEEDFGIVPVEVQAAGRPVIAYGVGGATETVLDGKTGVLFDRQSVDGVVDAITRFEQAADLWPAEQIQRHAQSFDRSVFDRRFERFYRWCIEGFRSGGAARVRSAVEQLPTDYFLHEGG